MACGSCGAKAPLPPHAQPTSQRELVPQDTEKSEFVDLVDFLGFSNFSRNCHISKEATHTGICTCYDSRLLSVKKQHGKQHTRGFSMYWLIKKQQ